MMHTIIKKLKLTDKERNKIMTDLFIMYCENTANDGLEFQLMIINKPLYNWFKRQFNQGEERFFNYLMRLQNPIATDKALTLYFNFVSDFIDKFSKRIMYEINRNAKQIRSQTKSHTGADRDNQIYLN